MNNINDINLNINTYSITELEGLFKLNSYYTKEDIIKLKIKLQNDIIKSSINEEMKEELLIFLDNANNKLINNLFKSSNTNDIVQVDTNHFIINTKNNITKSVLENNKEINRSIIKKTYTIDSLFRQNYDSGLNQSHNYIIKLPETITKTLTMSVSSIEIPLTYYNVSDELNNNIFHIKVLDINNNPTEIFGDIVLTSGLYESKFTSDSQIIAQDIETEIQNQIDAFPFTDIKNNLTFNINKKNGISYFTFNTKFYPLYFNNYKIVITFDVNNSGIIIDQNTNLQTNICNTNQIYQKLGWMLGFRVNEVVLDASVYNSSLKIANVYSRCICYINYPRYLYIAIDDFQSSAKNAFSIASDSIIAPNIIGRINILSLLESKTAFKQGANAGDYLYTHKHIREYFGPTDIAKLQIQLLDEYGRLFSLNNMDWSFILTFECLYN